MEAGYLNFTSEEFQILEDIEFDETIQRPEKVRFFTLEEQTSDAYEKLMPKGRTTRFQRDKVKVDIERIQSLYEDYIAVLPEEYRLRESETTPSLSWVYPVYSTDQRRIYDWKTQWLPLFDNLRQPNFYPALLSSLPRPFTDSGNETPYALTQATEFSNEEGGDVVRALPDYAIPRTQIHEDRTISVVLDPATGTADSVAFKGYFLKKRPLDIPNPLPDHPFLKENADTFVPSTAPLRDVLPSVDAVLTHAVPVTKDPYGEAMPYLKLYDINLANIPWASWKAKFPPIDSLEVHEAPAPIEFPTPRQLAVPEKISDVYGVPYDPGMSVRLWLMKRIDGGGLVVDLLRSMVIENGTVESVPGADIEPAAYPETTIDECTLTGKAFPDFNTTGLLRRIIRPDGKLTYQCVPLEFVRQERGRIGYVGRKPWKESTTEDMKKAYLRRLKEVTPVEPVTKKETPAAKTPARAESVRHTEVLAIENDPQRYAIDKARDIREVIRDGTTLTNQVYTDTDGGFVLCSHTLALLDGDLATDRRKFYDTWTARVDGFRVCRFCGEQINDDVYMDTEDYDEEGFLIRTADVLETGGYTASGITDYVSGLRKLQPLFVLDTPHDDTVFLVLSLLQVLPTADMLEPLLKLGRQVASVQFTKGSADQIARFQGMTGLATASLILQTHVPLLIPRRSFGSRPLILSGYPRDATTPAEYTIVDTLMTVLRKTFEAFPTTFRGPSKSLIRGILNKPGEVKTTVLALLSPKSPLLVRKRPDGKMEVTFVHDLLTQAKAFVGNAPVVEAPKTLIPVTPAPKEFDVITRYPACPSSRPIWTSGRPPRVTQPDIALMKGIQAAPNAIAVSPSLSVRVVPSILDKSDIRALLSTGTSLTTRIRVGDNYRTNVLLASHLADVFQHPTDVRTVDPAQKADELRDISRGYVYEQLAEIQANATTRTRLDELRRQDVALYVLQADYKEEKTQANKLRATERLKIVEDLKKKSDTERELIQQLLGIGAAPYLVTSTDRQLFAREAEQLQELLDEETAMQALEDAGVGLARDYQDDGDQDERGVDYGDYGDRAGLPVDRDYPQAAISDDASRSI